MASIGGVPLHPKLTRHIERAAGLKEMPELNASQAMMLRNLETKIEEKVPRALSPKKADPLHARKRIEGKRLNQQGFKP